MDRIGWHGQAFVLPDRTFGETDGERVLLQTASGDISGFEQRGTLADWQRSIAALCVGNSRLVLAVSMAFASPLGHWIGAESGGVHLVGSSSTGKTSALAAAVSVWGAPDRLQRWRATSNGLESVAVLHCDSLLCLDELAQMDAREAGEAAYLLANGSGKARSRQDGTARRRASWRLLFLSAGEIGLAEHMRSVGKQARAGQEIRLIDLQADAGGGYGLFEDLHDHLDGATFVRALNAATRICYGTAGRAYLEKLTGDPGAAAESVQAFVKAFVSEVVPPGADGQVFRVAHRFGLVAAGGELATAFGVTGWPKDEAKSAAKQCFSSWLDARGGAGAQEERAALEQIRLFFELHGQSRFADRDGGQDRTIINRAGFRGEIDGRVNYWVLPGIFRTDLCRGHDSRFVAKLLMERGWIVSGSSERIDPEVKAILIIAPEGGQEGASPGQGVKRIEPGAAIRA